MDKEILDLVYTLESELDDSYYSIPEYQSTTDALMYVDSARCTLYELKDKLIYVIANHMKKCFLTWNKDTVDDKVIFDHIFELSDGKIKLDRDSKPLTDSKDLIIMSNKRFIKSPKKGKKSYRNYKRK